MNEWASGWVMDRGTCSSYKHTQTHAIVLRFSRYPQLPLCHAPFQKTLRSLSPDPRHRGRSPEEGRKSHRTHSRRCSKTLGKASPEARSSHPPSQPVQMLSLLSARGVVSIPHSLLSQFWLRYCGGDGGTSSGQCMPYFNSVSGKYPTGFRPHY